MRTTPFVIKATSCRNKITSVQSPCPNLHFIEATVVGLIMLAIFIGFERFAARTQVSDSTWEPETVTPKPIHAFSSSADFIRKYISLPGIFMASSGWVEMRKCVGAIFIYLNKGDAGWVDTGAMCPGDCLSGHKWLMPSTAAANSTDIWFFTTHPSHNPFSAIYFRLK